MLVIIRGITKNNIIIVNIRVDCKSGIIRLVIEVVISSRSTNVVTWYLELIVGSSYERKMQVRRRSRRKDQKRR